MSKLQAFSGAQEEIIPQGGQRKEFADTKKQTERRRDIVLDFRAFC